MPTIGSTQDRICVHVASKGAFEGTSIKSVETHAHVGDLSKKNVIKIQLYHKGGPNNEQPRVVKLEYLATSPRSEKCRSWHVPLHQKK